MQQVFKLSLADIVPGRSINLGNILHGEQYIEFFGDVPLEGELTSKATVVEVLDKGSGAAVVFNGMMFFPIKTIVFKLFQFCS